MVNDGSSDGDDTPQFAPLSRRNTESIMEPEDRRELARIASVMSRRRSSVAGVHGEPLAAIDEDAMYNPENESFDIYKWIERFVEEAREEGFSTKNAGVSFKDVSVYGSGSAIQLQETVGTFATAPARVGSMFSMKKDDHKQILNCFNGLLKEGELLVVLGRPGSGCTTLLKTICGELHGLMLDDKSNIHYNGIPQKQMKKEFKGEAIYNQEVSIAARLQLQNSIANRDSNRLIGISLISRSVRPSSLLPTFDWPRASTTA